MKKYLTVLACCAMIGIGLNVHVQFQADQVNNIGITLYNIEALANGEDTGTKCPHTGCVDCPHGNVKVLYVQ